jgi:hypothetical protein
VAAAASTSMGQAGNRCHAASADNASMDAINQRRGHSAFLEGSLPAGAGMNSGSGGAGDCTGGESADMTRTICGAGHTQECGYERTRESWSETREESPPCYGGYLSPSMHFVYATGDFTDAVPTRGLW